MGKQRHQRWQQSFVASKTFTSLNQGSWFVLCRVTSKVLWIGAAERSWGDVKTIKSGKRSDIISYVSEKQNIVYTSAGIESARIEQYHSYKPLNDNCSIRTWNEEDDAFDQHLEKWGVETIFQIIQNLSK